MADEPPKRIRRTLRPDEDALWQQVSRNIKPLKKPADFLVFSVEPISRLLFSGRVEGQTRRRTLLEPPTDSIKGLPSCKHRVPGELESDLRRKIHRGQKQIDGFLDLHGCRYLEARSVLFTFLRSACQRNDRIVLVVTGKGAPEGAYDGTLYDKGNQGERFQKRGILRRSVREWLKEKSFADLVVSVSSAGRSHGGEGALYLYLRCTGEKKT